MYRPRRLLWNLYPTYLLVTVLCTVGLGTIALRSLRTSYIEQTAQRLETAAAFVGRGLLKDNAGLAARPAQDLCKSSGDAAGVRVTIVLSSGKVLGDSESDPKIMENHSDRPEIRTALGGDVGRSIRYSATLRTDMMYVAIPARQDGHVTAAVRTSVSLDSVNRALRGMYWRIAGASLIFACAAAGIGMWVSRRISRALHQMVLGAERFARGDLAHQVSGHDIDEISRLGGSLNRMAAELREKIGTITNQRNEQEAVLSSMVEGVIAVDPERRILSVNQAAARMFETDPPRALRRPLPEVVRNPEIERIVRRILEAGETVEEQIVLRGDVEQVFQVRGTLLRDAEGHRIGALVVVNDVSRLQRLESMRREFVANVSHELKTPITSIRGFVETLREGAIEDPRNASRFLDIIDRQSRRLNAIIEDLLQLSRIERESESGRIARTPGDIRELLDLASLDCATKALERNVEVRVDCPAGIRAVVNARMIEQAIVNLLDNAIKYSPPGSTVDLIGEAADPEILIHVRDRGPGIAPEHLPRIFERFYRVDKARSRDVGGTGLGLAIVKHIAQAHGGSVSVVSSPGQGSTFTIHLPRT